MLAGVAGTAGASVRPTGAEARPLSVVATTGMIGDLVAQHRGRAAEVTQLMGEGVDPHLYKTTRSDIARCSGADIVFYNGLLLEGKMTDALVRVATSGKPVFAVTELMTRPTSRSPRPSRATTTRTSGWTRAPGPRRRRSCATAGRARPGSGPRRTGATRPATSTSSRDSTLRRAVLASVAAERRVLVSAHDAFNYFGRRYAFEVLGVQGISTESEAGLRRVEELVGLIVARGIPAVFAETTVPDRTVRALIAGAEARGHKVAIGGSLFSDAMGAPGTYEGTYVGMIDHNVTTIARALGGQTPPRGLKGLLASAG
jgi:manganese/zinc/iron transport system substrate-binding protein